MLAVAAVGCSCEHSFAGLRIQVYKKMELTQDVEDSVAIKRKKPWPQLNWLVKELGHD